MLKRLVLSLSKYMIISDWQRLIVIRLHWVDFCTFSQITVYCMTVSFLLIEHPSPTLPLRSLRLELLASNKGGGANTARA